MTWLERVRQKNLTPHSRGTAKTDKSGEADPKNLPPYESGTAKTDKSQDRETLVSFGTPGVDGHQVFTEMSEVIIVAYQRFWLDYDLPDGTYTTKALRQAKMLVKPGPVLRYRLRWPGGIPQPMAHPQQKGS